MKDGTTSTGKRLWTVTGGAEKIVAEEAEREKRYAEIKAGLARCPVCKGAAEIVRFGFRGKGVWVGCDRTEACSRYIEFHSEGWSVEDTARDWNKRNRGVRKLVRLTKKWFSDRFGSRQRADKRFRAEIAAKKAAEVAKRREVFGINEPQRAKRWWEFGKKGNK